MLDFSKAFDRMCPSTAVRKMLLLNINPSLIWLAGDFLSSRSQYQGCVSSYQNSFRDASRYNPWATFVEHFHQWSHPCHQPCEICRWYNTISQFLQEKVYGNCVYCKHWNAATVERSLTGSYHLCSTLEQQQSNASQYHKVINHHIQPQEVNICWETNNIMISL